MKEHSAEFYVRETRPEDFAEIRAISRLIYPTEKPWEPDQLASHMRVFSEGQFAAVEYLSGRVVGMSASLIIRWGDYDVDASWREFTDNEMFTNHDPTRGRTLYGAEVMVHPDMQGKKIGKLLYQSRRELAERLGLLRILAGARLAGFHRYKDDLTPQEYTARVVNGAIGDKTLTFQLKRGFHVVTVVDRYLDNDPLSMGYAAIIEWLNPAVAEPRHFDCCDPRYIPDGETQLRPGRMREILKEGKRRRKGERLQHSGRE